MGEAADKLLELAGQIAVEAYRRRSSSGKSVSVSRYFRSPAKMSLHDIASELKSLRSDTSLPITQKNNRIQALTKEFGQRDWRVPHRGQVPSSDYPIAADTPSISMLKDRLKKQGFKAPSKVPTPSMDKITPGLKGSKGAKGTIDDPIDVSGDTMLGAKLLAEGKHIRLNHVDEVGTLLDKLAAVVEEAKAKGVDAPNFDLCKVSVPKTNLFCAQSKGVPRAKMPQFAGVARPGSKAAKLVPNQKGEVGVEQQFRDELKSRGIKITKKTVPAAYLKASQSELDGPKVAGIAKAMEAGKVPEYPIFVTKDGYIIDGHHRWAAYVAIDVKDNHLGDVTMPVEELDMEIGEALDFANAFVNDYGIQPKGLGKAAEGVGLKSEAPVDAGDAFVKSMQNFLASPSSPTQVTDTGVASRNAKASSMARLRSKIHSGGSQWAPGADKAVATPDLASMHPIKDAKAKKAAKEKDAAEYAALLDKIQHTKDVGNLRESIKAMELEAGIGVDHPELMDDQELLAELKSRQSEEFNLEEDWFDSMSPMTPEDKALSDALAVRIKALEAEIEKRGLRQPQDLTKPPQYPGRSAPSRVSNLSTKVSKKKPPVRSPYQGRVLVR